MSTYDAIVLGLGGMGSASLFHLARRQIKNAARRRRLTREDARGQ